MAQETDFADLADLPRRSGDGFDEMVMAHYHDLVESVRANEELGERRLAAYLTVIAAVTAAVGLASGRSERVKPLVAVGVIAALLLLAFGLMTLRRVMERNVTTSTYLNGLRRIRAYFTQSDPQMARLFAFPPERSPVERKRGSGKRGSRFGIGRGGLLETVAALNSVIAGVFVGGTVWLVGEALTSSLPIGAVTAIGAWFAQIAWALNVYETETRNRSKTRDEHLAAWMEWAGSRT